MLDLRGQAHMGALISLQIEMEEPPGKVVGDTSPNTKERDLPAIIGHMM